MAILDNRLTQVQQNTYPGNAALRDTINANQQPTLQQRIPNAAQYATEQAANMRSNMPQYQSQIQPQEEYSPIQSQRFQEASQSAAKQAEGLRSKMNAIRPTIGEGVAPNVAPEANPWFEGSRQFKMPNVQIPKGIGQFAGKALGTLGAAYGAAENFANSESGIDAYVRSLAQQGNPQAQNILDTGGTNPILSNIKGAVRSGLNTIDQPIQQGFNYGVNKLGELGGNIGRGIYDVMNPQQRTIGQQIQQSNPQYGGLTANEMQNLSPQQREGIKQYAPGAWDLGGDVIGKAVDASGNMINIGRGGQTWVNRGSYITGKHYLPSGEVVDYTQEPSYKQPIAVNNEQPIRQQLGGKIMQQFDGDTMQNKIQPKTEPSYSKPVWIYRGGNFDATPAFPRGNAPSPEAIREMTIAENARIGNPMGLMYTTDKRGHVSAVPSRLQSLMDAGKQNEQVELDRQKLAIEREQNAIEREKIQAGREKSNIPKARFTPDDVANIVPQDASTSEYTRANDMLANPKSKAFQNFQRLQEALNNDPANETAILESFTRASGLRPETVINAIKYSGKPELY